MIKVGIIGGAGYTAGELLRILVNHPEAEVVFAQSNSQAGKKITALHQDLIGDTDLTFSKDFHNDVDVLFICAGHGKTRDFLENNEVSPDVKIIDLSADYRAHGDHDFVYGLPEMQKEKIQNASKIANPGCFATCIQLGILPLAYSNELTDEVHIQAITGSTGAGVTPSATTHFSW
ncbi:MAG: N-acetyl-gamma-glutamyl-phosphate reductase, partial [Cyclobacteriaceae bacterium]|nr:N-acetyl-gamma-glutamyl-phosphate reductase [Cyclobacteriaceae bacterium]